MNEQDAWDAVSTIKILIRHDKWYEIGPPKSTRSFRILEGLLADMFVQGYLQVNRYQEILWFNQERYHDLLAWLAHSASINGIDQWGLMAEKTQDLVAGSYQVIRKLRKAEEKSDFQIEKLLAEAD